MHAFTLLFCLLFIIPNALVGATLPSKIYGVNLGSWLVLEPWMLPEEWERMGGQTCNGDCSSCIASEFAFAQAYPDTVDEIFQQHWETWFTQDHVNQLVGVGINTVRIPLGYWIIEPLVDRATEFYPRGGMSQLRRGLNQLKAAGIAVVLDHHALPGVASPNQMFAGRCTGNAQFYTQYNYHRALIWTAVMTTLTHVDPTFSTVASLEAVNEPIMDANLTPGLGQFEKNFVQTIRAVEYSLGIPNSYPGLNVNNIQNSLNVTAAIATTARSSSLTSEIRQVLQDALPLISQITSESDINIVFDREGLRSYLSASDILVTNFMDMNWQYNNPANPADAAIGPQAYDNHLYYSYGGVADDNEEAYLTSICNLNRAEADADVGDGPLWFGEWGLSTQFSATDDFLKKWADAQKFAYGQTEGWFFWNFRIEESSTAAATARQWSYLKGVELGYLTQDPSDFNDPDVCDAYISN